jgi:uncharacterized Rossmann fold enzyme
MTGSCLAGVINSLAVVITTKRLSKEGFTAGDRVVLASALKTAAVWVLDMPTCAELRKWRESQRKPCAK